MDPILKSVEEYIKSGEYFVDAKKWYNSKYLYPFVQRSILLIFCTILVIALIGISIQLKILFPIVNHVRYSIYSSSFGKVANVKPANQVKNNPLLSISNIMLENYILHRESYDYGKLEQQLAYVKNNSTKIIFRKFFNYISIDTPESPVMRYQKYVRRTIHVNSIKHINDNSAVIIFESWAKNTSGEILENTLWEATVYYDIDKINIKVPANSKFNFVVTGYKLKLMYDKLNK